MNKQHRPGNAWHWLGMGLLAALLSACGGGERTGTATPADAKATRVVALSAATSTDTQSVTATTDLPYVEDFVLVSSTRVNRTQYDYKFKLIVKGAYETYEDGIFSIEGLPMGSQTIVGSLAMGRIDGRRLLPSVDTITLRHDRTFPFVKSDLKFGFTGRLATTVSAANAPKIGPLRFLVAGGRPGHEGYFEIQSSAPQAGSSTLLQADLSGDIASASYAIRTADGTPLTTGPFNKRFRESNDANALVDIPTVPFTVTIAAVDTNGLSTTWTSALTTPLSYKAGLVTEAGVFQFGDSISAGLYADKVNQADRLIVELTLPLGFAAQQTHFEIPVGPAAEVYVPIVIQSPAAGASTMFYKVSTLTHLKSKPAVVAGSVIWLFAR